MGLSYFDLLSPNPVPIVGIGGIVSPKLRDISAIGYNTYQYYLSIIQMDFKDLSFITGQKAPINPPDIFDLFLTDNSFTSLMQTILNFFLEEDVSYSDIHKAFLLQKNNVISGMITKDNYPQVREAICLRNCICQRQEADLSKAKSKKALEIMKKLQKGRVQKAKQNKTDHNMELGNIISAVANKSPSLNILNIWDLTIYQIWDCFSRISNNSIYDIQSMSVAAWGDNDNPFDASAWFKRVDM